MKKIMTIMAATMLSSAAIAQTWNLDKAHSKLGFTITHLSVSDVDGLFKNFDANLAATKPDFSDAKVTLTADVKTINTDNTMRDEHLQKPDYLDAEKYPKLTFQSTSLKKAGANKYKMYGNLTLHGVTKPVVLDVTHRGTVTHPMNKKQVAGFKVTGKIKRTDFKISESTPNAMLSDEIELNANVEFQQG
ncbi:MAG TPA: YceI family protein [Flavipsychrobacter sp.]